MEKRNSDIRVIMITYNGSEFIQNQLNSIANQKNIESIEIYDDCSEQHFQQELKILSESVHAPINLHFNEKNIGVVSNVKNALSENLDADLIALSDQDDIWHPEKIQSFKSELISLTSSAEIPILVYSDMRVIDKENNVINPSFWSQFGYEKFEHTLHSLLFGNFVTGAASAFNPALAKYLASMPPNIKSYHDHWLAIAAFTFGKTKRIDKSYNDYRIHGNNQAFYSTRKRSLIDRRLQNVKDILNPELHMKNQFEIAEAFYDIHKDLMDSDKKDIFDQFLRSRSLNYFKQKLYRRRLFEELRIK
ncbi:glycosyltransferase [Roseivirga seohaensis]|uniref:glycosyltransferase n=1 Tax=Roseivirga seohaensis TaxID=1914963 RepID=UPI003BA88F1A